MIFNTTWRTAAIRASALFFASSALAVSMGAIEQRTRVIERSPLTPIADALRPDDDVVIIKDFRHVSGLVDEPVSIETDAAWLVDTSDGAFVIDVIAQEGRLIDSGLWVESIIRARVAEVVIERQHRSREFVEQSQLRGREIDLKWAHGGEVMIGRVKVQALPSQLVAGHRYLVLADRKQSTNEWYLGTRFEVNNDGLIRHVFEPDETRKYQRSPLDGLPLKQAIQELKRAAARAR